MFGLRHHKTEGEMFAKGGHPLPELIKFLLEVKRGAEEVVDEVIVFLLDVLSEVPFLSQGVVSHLGDLGPERGDLHEKILGPVSQLTLDLHLHVSLGLRDLVLQLLHFLPSK